MSDTPAAIHQRRIARVLTDVLAQRSAPFTSYADLREALLDALRRLKLDRPRNLVEAAIRSVEGERQTKHLPSLVQLPAAVISEPSAAPPTITHREATAVFDALAEIGLPVDLRGDRLRRAVKAPSTKGVGRPQFFPDLVEVPE